MRDDVVAMVDRAFSRVPREALVGVHELEQELEWLRQRAVTLARAEGYEWARIGRLLGRSRQAVRQRFGAEAAAAAAASAIDLVPPSRRRKELVERHRDEVHRGLAEARRRVESEGDDVIGW